MSYAAELAREGTLARPLEVGSLEFPPAELVDVFRSGGFEADTVAQEGLLSADDELLARVAQSDTVHPGQKCPIMKL